MNYETKCNKRPFIQVPSYMPKKQVRPSQWCWIEEKCSKSVRSQEVKKRREIWSRKKIKIGKEVIIKRLTPKEEEEKILKKYEELTNNMQDKMILSIFCGCRGTYEY